MSAKPKQRNQRLRKAREEHGWTQKDVAYQIDLPDIRTFRRWEQGETVPSLRYRSKLCELFAMSAEELGLVSASDLSLEEDRSLQEDMALSKETDTFISRSQRNRYALSKKRPSASFNWSRQQFLQKMRAFWVNDVLEKTLRDTPRITLELREEARAVTNAWVDIIEQAGELVQSFPDDTSIVQVYDEAGGELLLLGEPGAGKTILLLEVARELLQRAMMNENHLIPVVFNLSSWSLRWSTLEEWFVEELHAKYQVPPRIGRAWIEHDSILPLLDGLDEVNSSLRKSCAQAITSYREVHGLVPMVVCSRRQEYFALETHLLLQKAVSIQPLTRQKIDAYLSNGTEQMALLRDALDSDPELMGLVMTPLILNILISSFHERAVAPVDAPVSSEVLLQRIFATYSESMLKHRAAEQKYPLASCLHWLSFIALQMKQRYQTEFYPAGLQLDWLTSRRLRQLCHGLVAGFWAGLITGPLVGFIAFPLEGSIGDALIIAPILALLVGLITGIIGAMLEPAWSTPLKKASVGFIAAALVDGGVTWLGGILHWSLNLLVGAVVGVVIVAAFLLLNRQETAIRLLETPTWSWGRRWGKFSSSLLRATVLLIGTTLIGGLFAIIVTDVGLKISLIVLFCFVSFLINALLSSSSGKVLDEDHFARPDQGIRRSAFYAFRLGLMAVFLNWVVLVIIGVFVLRFFPDLEISFQSMFFDALAFACAAGIIVDMDRGGDACLKHFLLRLMLWLRGDAPWHYVRFLDYVAERSLLRKIGGGYMVAHRLLLDYFASLAENTTRLSSSASVPENPEGLTD